MRRSKHARRKAHCRLVGRAATRGLESSLANAARISSPRARTSLHDRYGVIASNSNPNSNRIISSRDGQAILYGPTGRAHGRGMERRGSKGGLTRRRRREGSIGRKIPLASLDGLHDGHVLLRSWASSIAAPVWLAQFLALAAGGLDDPTAGMHVLRRSLAAGRAFALGYSLSEHWSACGASADGLLRLAMYTPSSVLVSQLATAVMGIAMRHILVTVPRLRPRGR